MMGEINATTGTNLSFTLHEVNNPKLKNNMFSIPVLNKDYLWVETETGGLKGMETIEIKKVNNTIYTAGYKIKVVNSLKDMLKADND